MNASVVARLLGSNEPAIRYLTSTRVLGRDAAEPDMLALRQEIRGSPRTTQLLAYTAGEGGLPEHPYAKWNGAHWVLAALADIGYPPGDAGLTPLRERQLAWLLSKGREQAFRAIRGRMRFCASMEGNAVFSLLALGLADERTDTLVETLLRWQWPDGGWNCDKRPAADTSSFMESLIPLRSLALHARVTGNERSRAAAERAGEVFLRRGLFKTLHDGSVIHQSFVELHYPPYWHYDILFGLKVMAEAGFIGDARCRDALDLLEAKRLPDGGFPAEAQYYRTSLKAPTGRSPVGWGGRSTTRMNEWVTVDALYVLRAAGRG